MQTQTSWNIEYQNGKKSTFKTPSLDTMIKDWRDNTKEIDVRPRGEVIEEENDISENTTTTTPTTEPETTETETTEAGTDAGTDTEGD